MLKRKAYSKLEFWKENKTKQALLVTGARQVGKTYLIKKFAAQHYDNYIEFNLVENADARASLAQATSAEDFMFRVSVLASKPLTPKRTLIFIDEVQEAPELVTLIKFLVDKDDYDFIISGSMLGVELESIQSLPVGYLTTIEMYPLDFEEFCWANGLAEDPFNTAREHFKGSAPIPDYLHSRLMQLFHRYLLVGGMPDAVTAYLSTNSVDQVRIVLDAIFNFYLDDISKYAPKDRRLVIKNIFELIPSELLSQNRRFKLSSIEEVKRFSQVEDEFLWITKANVAIPTYNVDAPIAPLLTAENRKLLKLYLSDVGLLASRYPKEPLLGILDGKAQANLGGVYENFVAQELCAQGLATRYFSKRKIGEIDFLVEHAGGSILALEVKSGNSYRSHASLDNALAVKEYDISKACVLAETNIEKGSAVNYYPIYCAPFIKEAFIDSD